MSLEEKLRTLIENERKVYEAGKSAGGTLTLDTELSLTSENAVQNKVITEALDGKVEKLSFSSESGQYKVYAVNNKGEQTGILARNNGVSTFAIPMWDGGGRLVTNAPSSNLQCANKQYVDDKFNGSNKAVSFINYSSMITSLNTLANTSYSVGQNIMIVTLNVPDLWVSEIAEESVSYTYVSDDDFVNELNSNGFIQVGYFKLSALETQKVDLTEYAKNEDVEKKLDKVEPTTNSLAVYSVSRVNGVVSHGTTLQQDSPTFFKQWMIPRYMSQDSGASINQYANGTLIVPEPKLNYHCANKKYVDDNFAPKLVTHNITIKCSEGITDNANEFELRATLTSKKHDVYRSIEELEGIVVENAECWDLRGYWNEETMQDEPELRGTYQNVTIETRIETLADIENRKIAYLTLRDASGNVVSEVGSPDMFGEPSFYIASDIVE